MQPKQVYLSILFTSGKGSNKDFDVVNKPDFERKVFFRDRNNKEEDEEEFHDPFLSSFSCPGGVL